MDSKQFKKAANAAIDQIAEYYDTVGDRRVMSAVQPGYLKKLLPSGPPQEGEDWVSIQKDIETKIMPGLTHWASPNFMAYFPCNSSFPGMLGELYSAAFNCPAFNWICSPAVTELETVVLDWMATVWGLPNCFQSSTEGGGVIQGSASEAIATIMVAARDRYLRQVTAHIEDPEEREEAFYSRRSKLVALGGEYAHSSTQKAAQIAGVRFRSIPADNKYRLTGPSLRTAIDECIAKGLEPFYLTVTFGTTATCAIDDFEEITTVLKEHPRIWTHVDAAYAGAALVCPEYQCHTKHFASFDSFDTNMHKWLLTNFDASCLYVRKRKDLTETLSITPAYLRNAQSDSGLVTDYRDWQFSLGRRFRSLKIWFVLRTYGIKGLQEYIRNHIRLGEKFAEWIASRPDLFTQVTGPAFALNVLAIKPLEALKAVGGSQPNNTEHLTNGTTPTVFTEGHSQPNGTTPTTFTAEDSQPNDTKHLANGVSPTTSAEGGSQLNGTENLAKETTSTTSAEAGSQPNSTEHLTNGVTPIMSTEGGFQPNGTEYLINGTTPTTSGEGGSQPNGTEHLTNKITSTTSAKGDSQPNDIEHLANGTTPTNSAEGHSAEANSITKEVYDKITERGEVMLTSTLLGERYVIRVVSANPQTDEEHLKRAFDILVSTAEEIRDGKLQKALLTADVGEMHAGR